jgi:hypothetical protein
MFGHTASGARYLALRQTAYVINARPTNRLISTSPTGSYQGNQQFYRKLVKDYGASTSLILSSASLLWIVATAARWCDYSDGGLSIVLTRQAMQTRRSTLLSCSIPSGTCRAGARRKRTDQVCSPTSSLTLWAMYGRRSAPLTRRLGRVQGWPEGDLATHWRCWSGRKGGGQDRRDRTGLEFGGEYIPFRFRRKL